MNCPEISNEYTAFYINFADDGHDPETMTLWVWWFSFITYFYWPTIIPRE